MTPPSNHATTGADAREAPWAHYRDLAGRTVFVTGGATGIGAAIVAAFCRQGAKTVFVDVQADAGTDLAARLGRETGNRPVFYEVDVTRTDDLQAAIGRAHDETGDLYALVNNAAHDQRHKAAEVS